MTGYILGIGSFQKRSCTEEIKNTPRLFRYHTGIQPSPFQGIIFIYDSIYSWFKFTNILLDKYNGFLQSVIPWANLYMPPFPFAHLKTSPLLEWQKFPLRGIDLFWNDLLMQ